MKPSNCQKGEANIARRALNGNCAQEDPPNDQKQQRNQVDRANSGHDSRKNLRALAFCRLQCRLRLLLGQLRLLHHKQRHNLPRIIDLRIDGHSHGRWNFRSPGPFQHEGVLLPIDNDQPVAGTGVTKNLAPPCHVNLQDFWSDEPTWHGSTWPSRLRGGPLRLRGSAIQGHIDLKAKLEHFRHFVQQKLSACLAHARVSALRNMVQQKCPNPGPRAPFSPPRAPLRPWYS
jgi:hypothetical protein